MYILKFILLFLLFCTSIIIGYLISKRYSNRVKILKDIKSGLNIFAVKINFSCEILSEIFEDISNKLNGAASNIFKDTITILNENNTNTIGNAWEKSIEKNSSQLKKEDIDVLKTLGKMLGNTDIEGQINQINLVESFLEKQIEDSQEEQLRNSKLYKKLGFICGLVIVIVLI